MFPPLRSSQPKVQRETHLETEWSHSNLLADSTNAPTVLQQESEFSNSCTDLSVAKPSSGGNRSGKIGMLKKVKTIRKRVDEVMLDDGDEAGFDSNNGLIEGAGIAKPPYLTCATSLPSIEKICVDHEATLQRKASSAKSPNSVSVTSPTSQRLQRLPFRPSSPTDKDYHDQNLLFMRLKRVPSQNLSSKSTDSGKSMHSAQSTKGVDALWVSQPCASTSAKGTPPTSPHIYLHTASSSSSSSSSPVVGDDVSHVGAGAGVVSSSGDGGGGGVGVASDSSIGADAGAGAGAGRLSAKVSKATSPPSAAALIRALSSGSGKLSSSSSSSDLLAHLPDMVAGTGTGYSRKDFDASKASREDAYATNDVSDDDMQ